VLSQLLDLHGKQSYLLCDITKAYDRLVSMETLEGYSAQALEGRVEVLSMLKESALLCDGRVQQDKGLDLPMSLMPSALALLAQVRRPPLGVCVGWLGGTGGEFISGCAQCCGRQAVRLLPCSDRNAQKDAACVCLLKLCCVSVCATDRGERLRVRVGSQGPAG